MLFIVIIFVFVPVNLEGIQIHHINGNHWITSCSFGREVTVYDSKFEGDVGHISCPQYTELLQTSELDPFIDQNNTETKKDVFVFNESSEDAISFPGDNNLALFYTVPTHSGSSHASSMWSRLYTA